MSTCLIMGNTLFSFVSRKKKKLTILLANPEILSFKKEVLKFGPMYSYIYIDRILDCQLACSKISIIPRTVLVQN